MSRFTRAESSLTVESERAVRGGARPSWLARPSGLFQRPRSVLVATALLSCLVLAPLLLAGCQGFGVTKPAPAISLPVPPKAPVTVPLGYFRMEMKRYVTPLEFLSVRSVNEDQLLWHSLPRTTDWATVPRQGEGLASSIPLVEEGRHLLAAAPAGAVPRAASVEVIVDRTPPRLKVWFEALRRSSHTNQFLLRWRVDDENLATQGARLEWREPGGDWRPLRNDLTSSGSLLCPMPGETAQDHRLRLTARDLAGNEALIEVALGEAFDRRVWTAGASRNNAADDSAPVATVFRPEGRGAATPRRTSGGALASARVRPVASTGHAATSETSASGGLEPREETLRGTAGSIPRSPGSLPWPVRADEILAGGEKLPSPIRGAVFLVSPDGGERLLAREGNRIVLPPVNGAGFRLRAREEFSPAFAIDSRGPDLTLTSVESDTTGVRVSWRLTDRDESAVRVVARIASRGVDSAGVVRGAEPIPPIELRTSPQKIALPLGDYTITVEARDERGHITRSRAVEATVGVTAPSVRDLAGETIPGGRSRYLLIDRGAAEGTITLHARPVEPGVPIAIAEVAAGTRMVLWDVPPVEGRFHLEILWSDAAGEPNVRVLTPPFTIDSSWPVPVVALASATTRDRVRVTIETTEPLEVIGVARRRAPEEGWNTLEEGWRVLGGDLVRDSSRGSKIALEVDANTWGEGEWFIGIVIRDRWGQLLDEPIAAPVVVVDRTPPRFREEEFPLSCAEGVPLGAVVTIDESVTESTLTWRTELETVEIPHRRIPSERGVAIRVGALPAGTGSLLLAVGDRAGNRSQWERSLTVAPALLGPIVVYPAGRIVPPGDEIFVEVPVSPEALAHDGAELRLFDELGSLRAQQSLVDHARVSFIAPPEPGHYRLEVGPPRSAAFRGGVIEFRVDPGADPERRSRELVGEVRDWEAKQRREGHTEAIESARLLLLRKLEDELSEDPRRGLARRALARLHLLATPPRRDLAAETLQVGLRLALPDTARAALLNDLAVITLDSDPARARELLTKAVELDPTSLRYQNLADVAWRTGRFGEAARGYAAAFSLDPESTVSRDRWALAMARRGVTGRGDARRTLEKWYESGKLDRKTAEHLYDIVCGVEGAQR